MAQTTIIGTEQKFQLYISPLGSIRASQFDFVVKVSCGKASYIELTKDQCIMLDDDNFIVPVDTSAIGAGTIMFEITAYLPDGDFEDGIRTEKTRYTTDTVIVM